MDSSLHEKDDLRCSQCVLTDGIPDVFLDEEGVCNVCRDYELNRRTYEAYFREERDLLDLLEATRDPQNEYDVLLMYSGGKDSTYVLYRLLEWELRVLAVTFDNGYIPAACFENIRGVCDDTGVDSRVIRLDHGVMDRVFAVTLEKERAVCSGCFRALTARGTELAIDKKIPVVMTGLSRGQIFHTKVHQVMTYGTTDPEQVDKWLQVFRRRYHLQKDNVAELFQDQSLQNPKAFAETHFIDFYRYCDATHTDIVRLIQEQAPFWRKPENVGGCSSNCMINDVGISAFKRANGYHWYELPLAWEIRFGHISREEALEDLKVDLDEPRILRILDHLGVSL